MKNQYIFTCLIPQLYIQTYTHKTYTYTPLICISHRSNLASQLSYIQHMEYMYIYPIRSHKIFFLTYPRNQNNQNAKNYSCHREIIKTKYPINIHNQLIKHQLYTQSHTHTRETQPIRNSHENH